jgi:predicted lipoprotein with Yx(FWY)xxD motif
VTAFAVLATLALVPARANAAAKVPANGAAPVKATPAVNDAGPGRARFPAQIPAAIARAAQVTTAALTIAAGVLLGIAVAGAAPAAPAAASSGAGLKTTVISGTTVLTNAKGFTLYSFAPDTPAASKCYGNCAAYWPPVPGTAAASPVLPGRVGTITRTGGTRQLTYNGHPLYTYIGDSAPGQARGNNLYLNGGLWHEVPVSH